MSMEKDVAVEAGSEHMKLAYKQYQVVADCKS